MVPPAFPHPALHRHLLEDERCWGWFLVLLRKPLPATPAHAGLGDDTRHSERRPSEVSGCAFDTSTALLDRDAGSVGRAAVSPCQDWLPFR